MSDAVAGFGTIFTWDSVDIAELTNISGPGESMDTIEVTHHESSDAYKEYIAGLLDGGDISIEGNLIVTDSTGQVAMHTDFQAREAKDWIIKFPSWSAGTPQFSGSGLVTAFNFTFPHDDKIGFTATIKVTGKPTYAPA